MFIFRYLILILNPLLYLVFMEWVHRSPAMWWLPLLSLTLLIVTIWEFTKRQFTYRWFMMCLSPVLLIVCSTVMMYFVEVEWLYRLIGVISALVIFFVLEQIMNYFYFTSKYQPYSLESLSWYSGVWVFFLGSCTLFATLIFLQWAAWVAAIMVWVLSGLVVWQVSWSQKIEWRRSQVFVWLLPVLMAEMFLVLSFWPVSFFISGLLLTLGYYVLLGLSRLFWLESLSSANVSWFLGLASIATILTVLSAHWI